MVRRLRDRFPPCRERVGEEKVLRRVDNAHYWTRAMDDAVAFYRDVLGLALIVRAGDDWAEFDAGGTTVALHGARGSSQLAGATVVFAVDDLDKAMRGMQERGISFEGEVREAPGLGRFASFRDPDGNLLQILERPPEQ
jgi:predicted enzyme related to lactoylglutathione lyase